MKILIVDDEPLARMRLKSMLEHLSFEHVIEAKHGLEGVEMAKKYLPELIFMDIEMPELDGIQAAVQIKKNHPSIAIIFSTAHDDFALKAFDLSAADYLLKPLSLDRLKQAIEKVGLDCGTDKIKVKRGNSVILVPVNEIVCFVAEDKYVTAFLNEQSMLLDQSLAEIESTFSQFVRIHRNALINPDYLTGVHVAPGKPPMAIMRHIEFQPIISGRQLPALRKLIKEL